MISVPSLVTFFLRVDSKVAPFILHIVEGVGTPTLLQDRDMFSFQGVTMLRLNDVILAGTAIILIAYYENTELVLQFSLFVFDFLSRSHMSEDGDCPKISTLGVIMN